MFLLDQVLEPQRLLLGRMVLLAIFVPLERLCPIVRRDFFGHAREQAPILFTTSSARSLHAC